MRFIQDIWAAGTSSLFEHWREETFMILYQFIWKGHGASLQIYHYRVSSYRQEHTYQWCRSSMTPYSPCTCCVYSTRSYFAGLSTTVDWSGRDLGIMPACCRRATNHYDDWYQCAVSVLDPLLVKGRGQHFHKKCECDRKEDDSTGPFCFRADGSSSCWAREKEAI